MGDFFFYLTGFVFFRCRSYVLFPASVRSFARAYLLAPLSAFISFTLVSYFPCYSSLGSLDCCLVSQVSARSRFFLRLFTISIIAFQSRILPLRFLLHLIILCFTFNSFHIAILSSFAFSIPRGRMPFSLFSISFLSF